MTPFSHTFIWCLMRSLARPHTDRWQLLIVCLIDCACTVYDFSGHAFDSHIDRDHTRAVTPLAIIVIPHYWQSYKGLRHKIKINQNCLCEHCFQAVYCIIWLFECFDFCWVFKMYRLFVCFVFIWAEDPQSVGVYSLVCVYVFVSRRRTVTHGSLPSRGGVCPSHFPLRQPLPKDTEFLTSTDKSSSLTLFSMLSLAPSTPTCQWLSHTLREWFFKHLFELITLGWKDSIVAITVQ